MLAVVEADAEDVGRRDGGQQPGDGRGFVGQLEAGEGVAGEDAGLVLAFLLAEVDLILVV